MKDREEGKPKRKHGLFKGNSDAWWHNACINFMNKQWGLYACGYKQAADIVARHTMDDRSGQDYLVFPIVFLYRQYLELRLKELTREGSILIERPLQLEKHHDLGRLWAQARLVLEEVWPDEDPEPLDDIERCIRQFSETDPGSTAFRYPIDKKGGPSLPDITHINIENLIDTMDTVSALLDGASTAITTFIDDMSQ